MIALNTTRSTDAPLIAFFRLSASSTCQLIASPSRSGSVARIRRPAPFIASAMSFKRLADLGSISQLIAKSSSGRTEPSLLGRSRT